MKKEEIIKELWFIFGVLFGIGTGFLGLLTLQQLLK